jgi:predicted RecB family nuclease
VKLISKQLRLSATDLSNHLACRHLSSLNLALARGQIKEPQWAAADLVVIQQLGLRHEAEYLKHLREVKKLNVVELPAEGYPEELLEQTRSLMAQGADAIAQGALGSQDWYGRPDVLLKVPKPSEQWRWSYEAADTKLARETKGTTILQLALYTELLEKLQGSEPELMWVIPPGNDFAGEAHRFAEFAAYYRLVKQKFLQSIANRASGQTYPEPVEHCNICRWFRECDKQRRDDDHLSLVAGIRRHHREQLVEWKRPTVVKLAQMPIPLKEPPKRGSRNGYARVREQARVQVEGRATKENLVHEPVLPFVAGTGLSLLPEPTQNDIFLDFEGDRFVGESGLQYLTGIAFRNVNGELVYEKRWALNRREEREAFEWLMEEIVKRREANPKMHVYHFGAYEKTALSDLSSLYATHEENVDRLLRSEALVDLHLVFRQGLRASVEEYSLKKLEVFSGYERKTPFEVSRKAMRIVEHGLELGRLQEIEEETRQALEGYNQDDCFATACLTDWLEGIRKGLIEEGHEIERPEQKSGDPSENLKKQLERAEKLTGILLKQVENKEGKEADAQRLLAQLVSWHRREDKRVWQDGYRYAAMEGEELLDERVGLTQMRFVERLVQGKGRFLSTDRYEFEPHKTNVRAEKDVYCGDEKFGEVIEIDAVKGNVAIKKAKKMEETHPTTVYMWKSPISTEAQTGALCRIGEWVAENGVDADGKYRAGRDLLLRKPPRLADGETLEGRASETVVTTLERIGISLQESTFAIQGPPGAGKTYAGARMICELVKNGLKVGVTALSHKVKRNLLESVVQAAIEKGLKDMVRCLDRDPDGEESDVISVAKKNNEEAWSALEKGTKNVVGGVSWLWAPEKAFECVDVLFIDEAGQMSLADVLAVSQAGKKLVLLGDPQQLERPMKGKHPEGAETSALEHLLDGRKTIREGMGFFLPESFRLHPEVCKYTSELFYESRLGADELTRARVIEGHPWLKGSGLWFIPLEHQGNRNSSAEEIEVIGKIVNGLLKPRVEWFYSKGNKSQLREKDILIVAPYNAQVADLSARLPGMKIGTVDKFQGQEAAVVIYSMTTSSPEDAPHGMEFLFSLNRFNVATSRAKTAVIVVGNPRLFEAECRTPRQMQLANALCRYVELATVVSASNV